MTSHAATRERAQRALQLRAMGQTWDSIAKTVGYRSRQAPQLAVKRLLASHHPDPETERAVSSESLRLLQSTLFSRLAAANARGDTDELVKLSKELRSLTAETSKLNGLYAPPAPQRVEVEVRPAQEMIASTRDQLLALVDGDAQPILEGEVVP
ncbi:hypothetical protein QNM97_06655 [Gordonia sp. L191]|uniref:hypothetical protein n=1 Tax=Gordonia sp. L191 TaxID=2982699 RepID=UPI0024BF3A34|nr:hypothetical protein [Gordonia sp. L191]WHU48669.1 hypothetical protein QNM97_06655 [Gordonia sp. L191]